MEEYNKKHSIKRRADKSASLLLNKFGVPGLRFFDRMSRKNKQGTHNFVIWDTDALTLLGLTDDSDTDAKDYFEKTRTEQVQAQSEVYSQTHFVSHEQIERYNQDSYQGTGNIILGNEMRLEYIGSGEGSKSRGYGIYSAQVLDTAATYRKSGLIKRALKEFHVNTPEGDFTFDASQNYNDWDGISNNQTKIVLDEIVSTIRENPNFSLSEIKKTVKHLLKSQMSEARKKGYSEIAEHLAEQINILNSIKISLPFDLHNSNGNIYKLDVPENDDILDWDKTLSNNPAKIKEVIKQTIRIINNPTNKNLALLFSRLTANPKQTISEIKSIIDNLPNDLAIPYFGSLERKMENPVYRDLMNIFHDEYTVEALLRKAQNPGDISEIKMSKTTGEKLYWTLTDLLGSDKNASMYLNSLGIPGHRFLDKGSRANSRGTYNFVTWNTDRIKVLGLTEDSDQDAKDYFERTRQANSESYNQSAINTNDIENSLNIARTQLEAVRKKYKGTAQYMKAPNGKKTKLTERQWLQVRTENFKAWFGDWENDPEHSSKVLDENGEPMVVYHGAPHGGFSEFNVGGATNQTRNTGAYFSSTISGAEFYTKYAPDIKNPQVYPCFINMRNPYEFNAEGRYWANLGEVWIEDSDGEPIYEDNYGDAFATKADAYRYLKNVLHSEEGDRYTVQTNLNTTDDIIRAVWAGELGDGNHDGVIFRDVCDPYEKIDEFITRTPENIMSATRNTGEFGRKTGDIYHQSAPLKKNEIAGIGANGEQVRFDTPDEQLKAVRKKYYGTDKWLKAPNGKKSKLSERQWLQVRTEDFKRWFGDWEAAQLLKTLKIFSITVNLPELSRVMNSKKIILRWQTVYLSITQRQGTQSYIIKNLAMLFSINAA